MFLFAHFCTHIARRHRFQYREEKNNQTPRLSKRSSGGSRAATFPASRGPCLSLSRWLENFAFCEPLNVIVVRNRPASARQENVIIFPSSLDYTSGEGTYYIQTHRRDLFRTNNNHFCRSLRLLLARVSLKRGKKSFINLKIIYF